MSGLATIAATDLRRRIRNRSAVVTAVVAPLALAAVFGLLLGGTDSIEFRIGVTDEDRSEVSRGLVASLTGDEGDVVRLVEIEGTASARDQVDDGDVDAAIVVPAGFGAAATSGGSTALEVLRDPARSVAGQVAEAIATEVAGEFRRVDVAVRTVAGLTEEPPGPDLVAAAQERPAAIGLDEASAGDRAVSAEAFYGAAMAILFLFFTVGYAPASLIEEQRRGTLDRVLATPVRPAAVIGGKVAAVAALAFAGFVVVWLATSLGFGATWGDPAGVLAVIVAMVLAASGVSVFVAAFARTPQQVESLTTATTFVLALLGGNFVGPDAPETLERLALLTPNGWALRAFTDLSAGVADAGEVLLAVGVLLAFGLVFGAIGVVRVHRGIVR